MDRREFIVSAAGEAALGSALEGLICFLIKHFSSPESQSY
jgi:hypothetical protein